MAFRGTLEQRVPQVGQGALTTWPSEWPSVAFPCGVSFLQTVRQAKSKLAVSFLKDV